MKVYLARFEKNNKVSYKIGHTKFFYSIKRFADEQYKVFDNITIVEDINVQHASAITARLMAQLVEEWLHGVFPKNFRLESHFVTEENLFDGLSGITEMFILEDNQTEDDVKRIFLNVKKILRGY